MARSRRAAPAARHSRTVDGLPPPPLASIGDSFSAFFDAVGDFAGNLADVQWGSLLLALAAFALYLSLRARASFNILRAAYPGRAVPRSA